MIITSYNTRGLGRREKRKDVKGLLKKVKPDVCCLQESKLERVDSRLIKSVWGYYPCDWDFAKADRSSGGIISIWNPSVVNKVSSWSSKDMLVLNGYLVEDENACTIVNVYAPNISSLRNDLCDQLSIIVSQRIDNYVCIIGDFNCVRNKHERQRRGITWNIIDMENFNNFIEGNNLVELNLSGRAFTWYRPNGTCKSRLDRMFVNVVWVSKWPHQVLKGGRRTLSDHRPIFVEATLKEWGPTPFCFFNS